MFFPRDETGKSEPTPAGLLLLLLGAGTFLVFGYALIRLLDPGLPSTTGGYASILAVTLLQVGKGETWKTRLLYLAFFLLSYGWCVSLSRVMMGGNMVVYGWGALVICVTCLLPWLWIDRRSAQNESGTV